MVSLELATLGPPGILTFCPGIWCLRQDHTWCSLKGCTQGQTLCNVVTSRGGHGPGLSGIVMGGCTLGKVQETEP